MRHLDRPGSKTERGALGTPWNGSHAALATVVGLVGVLAVHHPMILSGFVRIQTDLGDTRLLNYFLEHGWLWWRGAPRHQQFWNAPFFHPVPNVMAFSDCMLSYGPLYWMFRRVGLAPDTAFGAWMAAVTGLNFAAGLLLFRRGLDFGAPAATAAAGLIAFGAPRVNFLHHPQLQPFFYSLLALYALCRIVRSPTLGAVNRNLWWSLFGLAVAAQFYGGYYLGWFLGVGLGSATVIALLIRSTRGRVIELARCNAWASGLGTAVALLALLPFLAHYLPAARELGGRFHNLQHLAMPTVWSWWNVGENNWFWGWMNRGRDDGSMYPEELRMGMGFATICACLLGFYLNRRQAMAKVTMATLAFGVTAMTVPLTDLGAAAACVALACLFREPKWDGPALAAVVLATLGLLYAPLENLNARALTFVTMAFCLARIWSNRTRVRSWPAPAAVLAALCFHALPAEQTLLLAEFFATVGALTAWFSPGRRIEAALVSVAVWLAVSVWLTVDRAPGVFYLAGLGAAAGWASASVFRPRLSAASLAAVVGVAIPAVVFPFGAHPLWVVASPLIPGAGVVRMPSRVILALLVPAALGLAFLVERLDRGRRGRTAWCVALICLIEQTVTTPTFDRESHRQRIATLARRIDPHAGAFYYRTTAEDGFPYHVHLDAMWAANEVGVPTINGVSGCFPPGWTELGEAGLPGRMTFENALQTWRVRHGAEDAEIQIISRRGE